MSAGELQHGQVVRMTHFTSHWPNLQMTYKAVKEKVFLFILLGTEDRDKPKSVSPLKLLNDLGWKREGEKEGPKTSYCATHNTYPLPGEPCWGCANPLIKKAYEDGKEERKQ